MPPEIKKLWVEELRSGRYLYTRIVMKRKASSFLPKEPPYYSVLGVLVEVLNKENKLPKGITCDCSSIYSTITGINYLQFHESHLKEIGLSANQQQKLMKINEKEGKDKSIVANSDDIRSIVSKEQSTCIFNKIADWIEVNIN